MKYSPKFPCKREKNPEPGGLDPHIKTIAVYAL